MQRTGMINKIGCFAIVLIVILAIVLGASMTHGGLKAKQGDALKEMETLKEILAGRLDTPEPLGAYIDDKAAFDSAMGEIKNLKTELDKAGSLPELDELLEDFKRLSMQIRNMVPLSKVEEQAVRDIGARIDGTNNRWIFQREKVVEAITVYNSALSSFPASMVGGFFGLEEMPLEALVDTDE
jgi:hypothetical protein